MSIVLRTTIATTMMLTSLAFLGCPETPAERGTAASTPTPTQIENAPSPTSTPIDMNKQQTVSPQDPETWGAPGINMVVNDDETVTVEFDCATATLASPIKPDAKGKFSQKGEYQRQMPGPVRPGRTPKPQEVTFEGTVEGTTMKLKIVDSASGDLIATYNLEKGKSGRIRRCL